MCCMYRGPEERDELLEPYLAEGLRADSGWDLSGVSEATVTLFVAENAPFTVSVTVSVRLPTALRVTLKVTGGKPLSTLHKPQPA